MADGRPCATMPPMSRPPRDPLLGVDRLIVDGTNLLYALSRGTGPAPAPTLIGRLRGAIPPSIRIELLFDGPSEPRMRSARIASGVNVQYAGRLSADELALRLVTEATGGRPDQPGGIPTLLVVTDDGRLARELRARGAATIGASWLVRRLDRPRLSSVSAGRPRPVPPAVDEAAGDNRIGWRPGRGATTKVGNPHRVSRRQRPPN
jgi:hypothetical protein